VDEALHAPSSIRNAIGDDGSTGWDWIVYSFKAARSAFPSSKLLINEYGIINDASELSKYVEINSILKDQNLIDGIGIECHQFNMNDLSASTITSNLNTLAATGLPITHRSSILMRIQRQNRPTSTSVSFQHFTSTPQ
jgi:endo-1,4-beta-xylanase